MPLTKIEIEKIATAPKVKEVRVDLLGDTVYMRQPNMAEWRSIHSSHIACGAQKEGIASMPAMAEAVGAVLSDSEGKRLFSSKEEADLSDKFGFEVFMQLYHLAWTEVLSTNHGEEGKKD